MIPGNKLSDPTVRAPFLYPYNLVRGSLLEDWQIGGVALQDPSQGFRVHPWYGRVDKANGNVYLRPGVDGKEILVYTIPNCFEFAFAFDQNMRWVGSFTDKAGNTVIYRFDAASGGYIQDKFTGINGVRLTLDDTRSSQLPTGNTDIIMTYLKTATGELCFRSQRDNYAIEHILSKTLPNGMLISNFGMCSNNRLGWRIKARTFSEVLPWN